MSIEAASPVISQAWSEAVYAAMVDLRMHHFRVASRIQVSRQWYEDNHRPVHVWGVPIEVDPYLYGDGFRLVA